jgi:uncharacterized DUF497 family protein
MVMNKIFEQVLKETEITQEEYKDSENARFQEEEGDPNEDVIVKDRFKNGKAFTFIWNRGKSNENLKDIGQGKAGFSFYQARYVYRDPYLDKDSVKTTNLKGRSVVGIVFENDKEAMLVIQERFEGKDEEGDPKIRIFSATYANDNVQLAYFRRAFEIAKRNGGELERLEESLGDDDFIAFTTIKHRKLFD